MTFVTRDSAGNPVTIDSETVNAKELQRTKIVWGGDGVANIVDAATGLPVQIVAPLPAGGNVIGHIVVDQLPALPTGGNTIGTVDVASDPVQRTVDAIAVAQQTDALMNGATVLTPKFKKIALSATGQVVAGVPAKKIRVLAWSVMAGGVTVLKWQSHTAPTDLTGLYTCTTNSHIEPAYCPVGHFETVAGEDLDLNLSLSVTVGGYVVYVEV